MYKIFNQHGYNGYKLTIFKNTKDSWREEKKELCMPDIF